MAKGKPHSEDVRAQVMAALLAGQSVGEIAAQYNMPERTVRLWREGQIAEVCRKKQERIATAVLDYLNELFVTLAEQQKVFRDAEYLKEQSAAENATLHGVLADKGFRGLDALARLEGESSDSGESGESPAGDVLGPPDLDA